MKFSPSYAHRHKGVDQGVDLQCSHADMSLQTKNYFF